MKADATRRSSGGNATPVVLIGVLGTRALERATVRSNRHNSRVPRWGLGFWYRLDESALTCNRREISVSKTLKVAVLWYGISVWHIRIAKGGGTGLLFMVFGLVGRER